MHIEDDDPVKRNCKLISTSQHSSHKWIISSIDMLPKMAKYSFNIHGSFYGLFYGLY